MTDVVLIAPAYYYRKKKVREQPQLGLAYIAAYLEEAGINVSVIDAAIYSLSSEKIAEQVKQFNPIVVGITGCTDDRYGMIETIQAIRNVCKDVLIVGGGPHFSYTSEDALKNIPALDIVVVGEGEETMLQLVREFQSDRNLSNCQEIKGITYRRNSDEIARSAIREPIRDLNTLPRPAWHLFEIDKYQGIMSAGAPYRSIGIISSRGCPYLCVYCSNSLNRKVRYINPVRFVDECEFLMHQYGFQAMNFQDDSFTVNRNHTSAICNEILFRKLKIKWYCSLRIETAAQDKELLKLMKKAGCIALGFGIEFPSDDVLIKIQKNLSVQVIKVALQNTAEVGFPYVNMFLMNSMPGQTRLNTIQAQLNINLFKEILYGEYPYTCHKGALARMYPCTELTILGEKQGLLPTNFSWNSYFENPRTKKGDDFWSMPVYENKYFPVKKINQTVKETTSYLKVLDMVNNGKIKSIILSIVNPFKWKMFFNAARIWLTLKRGAMI